MGFGIGLRVRTKKARGNGAFPPSLAGSSGAGMTTAPGRSRTAMTRAGKRIRMVRTSAITAGAQAPADPGSRPAIPIVSASPNVPMNSASGFTGFMAITEDYGSTGSRRMTSIDPEMVLPMEQAESSRGMTTGEHSGGRVEFRSAERDRQGRDSADPR
jgi:hypothetical protein